MALAIIGKGKVFYNGKIVSTRYALKDANLTPISAKNLDLLRKKMVEAAINPFIQPGFFLADPLGNIILSYQGDIDPKKILSDIKKLLRASKIG